MRLLLVKDYFLLVYLRLLLVYLRLLLVYLRLLLVKDYLLLVKDYLLLVKDYLLLRQFIVAVENLRVAALDDRDKLLLDVHILAQLRVASSHSQPLDDMLHVGIATVEAVVDIEHLTVLSVFIALVENAQHLLQTAVSVLTI